MTSFRQLVARLFAFFHRRSLEAEMAEEMRQHLDRRTREKIAEGMAPDDARFAAQREFGGLAQVQEQCRDERRLVVLEQLLQDARYAFRALRKSPGFAVVVILSLAIGLGANTAVFSLVNEVLLRSLPVRDPDELVMLRYRNGEGGRIPRATENNSSRNTSFSLLTFERFRAQAAAVADVFAYAPFGQVDVSIDGEPEVELSGQFVSGNYHRGLGVTTPLGRSLASEDDLPSAEPVAIISHRFWQRRFNGDPTVLGRIIQLNRVATTIVGVTPAGFEGSMQAGDSIDVSVPFALFPRVQPERAEKLQPWFWWVHLMARLQPGVMIPQFEAALQGAFHHTAQEAWNTRPRAAAPGEMPALPTLIAESGARGEIDRRLAQEKSLRLLQGLAGLVLLAVCANLANLLVARGASRRREIAVRLALGASRGRIVRQLLAESLLLTLAGAVIGTLLALWARGALLALRPLGQDVVLALPLDWRVFGFTVSVAGAVGLLSSLAPALRATKLDVAVEFQGGARTLSGGARSRLSRILMIVQIALSLVLLVGAGLFARTLAKLEKVDPGFNRHGLVLLRIEATPAGYAPTEIAALHERLRARLEKVPGASAVTYSEIPLISGRRIGRFLTVPGYTPKSGQRAGAMATSVAPNFFAAMEMPLLLGRGYTERDDVAAPKVAVVNETFVREFFGDGNALGRHFSWGDSTVPIEIVGVVRDAKYTDLRDKPSATVYPPLLQLPGDGTANFAIRSSASPAVLFPAIRAAVREIDPRLPVRNLRTQQEQLDRLNAQPILFARLAGFFGLLALLLACMGLYGLMSYQVLRRTGEIGLRGALGARPAQIVGMILRESLGLVSAGIVAGLVIAAFASQLVAAMLFGLSPIDGATYALVALGLVITALFAALLPARRAAKIDPMVALRCD